MKNPLTINIRCTCIEEYIKILDLHETFRRQKMDGEILSIYVGATPAMYGKSALVDKLLDRVFGDGARPVATERIVKERLVGAQGNGDGTVTETYERTFVPTKDLDEAREEPHYDDVPCTKESSISEFAIGDRAEEFHYEDNAKPEIEREPEITLTDVLTAMAEEPDPMEAIKTEAEGEPDGDGQDYNTTYAG